jgi:hypothetical protein
MCSVVVEAVGAQQWGCRLAADVVNLGELLGELGAEALGVALKAVRCMAVQGQRAEAEAGDLSAPAVKERTSE